MKTVKQLREEAELIKMKLRYGQIAMDEAKKELQPFKEAYDKLSREKAEEFGVPAGLLNLSSFLR
jgi:hypothetical protein